MGSEPPMGSTPQRYSRTAPGVDGTCAPGHRGSSHEGGALELARVPGMSAERRKQHGQQRVAPFPDGRLHAEPADGRRRPLGPHRNASRPERLEQEEAPTTSAIRMALQVRPSPGDVQDRPRHQREAATPAASGHQRRVGEELAAAGQSVVQAVLRGDAPFFEGPVVSFGAFGRCDSLQDTGHVAVVVRLKNALLV